jgi:hypothetical protein
MKMRHVVAVTSAALISFGALAGGQLQSSAGSGAESTTIRQAQEKLAAQGFEQTQQGLKDFQQANGLEPTGQLDAQTVAAHGLGSEPSAATGGSSPGTSESEPAQSSPQSSPERAAEPGSY